MATEEETREALEQAFGYRGDVTITLKTGVRIEGYIFDRRPAAGAASRHRPHHAERYLGAGVDSVL